MAELIAIRGVHQNYEIATTHGTGNGMTMRPNACIFMNSVTDVTDLSLVISENLPVVLVTMLNYDFSSSMSETFAFQFQSLHRCRYQRPYLSRSS